MVCFALVHLGKAFDELDRKAMLGRASSCKYELRLDKVL